MNALSIWIRHRVIFWEESGANVTNDETLAKRYGNNGLYALSTKCLTKMMAWKDKVNARIISMAQQKVNLLKIYSARLLHVIHLRPDDYKKRFGLLSANQRKAE